MRIFRKKLALAALGITMPFSCGAAVVINEVHYDPDVKTELVEFIELHNTATEPASLAGWSFSDGVTFQFPAGTSIAGGGYLVVAQNPAALQAKFGVTAVGPWVGVLANEGETITLRDAAGEVADEVSYKLGFPWPTVGTSPGYSMELVNPLFDNDLGGSWRRSLVGNPTSEPVTLVGSGGSWKYLRGVAAPSSPSTAWRAPSFDDAAWSAGTAPIGYDPSIFLGTQLSDMRHAYTSVFFRKKFNVANPSAFSSLRLHALYDDGFKVWINGAPVLSVNISSGEVPFNGTAGPARESASFEEFIIPSPGAFLVQGENTIAIQAHNSHISNSSDFYLDIRLLGETGATGAGPTPGARNVTFSENIPPHLRQASHAPARPESGEPVAITVKATDPDGVASVQLTYQIVQPGSYIELDDAAYETGWVALPMQDDGTNGDALAGDSIYTAVVPGAVQQHRRLIRYRITATDSGGRSLRAPYADDPVPNFAYFVYDRMPDWEGAARPGVTPVETFPGEEMSRLPAYHLIAKRSAVEDATWRSKYSGDLYRWSGTLVYEGKVYDHIRYRARGGVWRYAMGKNMWKFDFNKGHDFQARDNYGREYETTWRKLNLGANIQQGNYLHRGEQGMFESVGFKLFNLAGVESPKTHWATLRIVDEAVETGPSQHDGDFWGLYLAIEQEDGRFLDEHHLPDGNLYKMEGGSGELNNQGRTAPSDKSDLNTFLDAYRSGNASLSWWRDNLDTERYFSYQAIVQGIHHYDICDGKNYFYYHNPETDLWSVHSWDLDLTWANNMYRDCAGADDLKNRVLANPVLAIEHKNRLREIRDLLFNTDQAIKVIQEQAALVKGPRTVNILGADRAMWDYHPVMINSDLVNLSKAGQGLFYTFPLESGGNPALRGSFDAGVRIMTNYVVERSAFIDNLARDTAIPATPSISYTGPAGFPLNRISLRSSSYSGQSAFAAMEWRVGEIRLAAPGTPGIYEIEPLWESGERTPFQQEIAVPPDALKVGHAYRARVRMKDVTGRWSHWSPPVEFTTSEPDNAAALQQFLRVREVMYNPPDGSDFEFVELQNISTEVTLQLGGVAFTDGIEFVFPEGATLAPQQFGLVTKFAPNAAGGFRQHYEIGEGVPIFGPVDGNLNNGGERITIKTGVAGAELVTFSYNNRAGWPVSPDGTGHSLVPIGAGLEYPGSWRPSAFIGGSPGAEDVSIPSAVLINEIAAHTGYSDPERPEYDSNDWIELVSTGGPVELEHYYLSDDADELKKWAIPVATLESSGRISFDEVAGFHNPITSGFGLDQAGEAVYLSYLPPTGPSFVVDAVAFKGQESGKTWGRFPDGGPFFYSMPPTRDLPNGRAERSLVISELMYHPEDLDTVEPQWQEFVEIYNPGTSPVPLWNGTGTYRIDGGINFSFPGNVLVPPGAAILLVTFDPASETELSQFRDFYDIPDVPIYGPYAGKLANSSDRVALEKPEAPGAVGESPAWVLLDEVIYADQSPWPGADGAGHSLHRRVFAQAGNDSQNWTAAAPSPGAATPEPADEEDSDGDGMPDVWELQYQLDPNAVADAGTDLDGDGLSNLEEYQAGTAPDDPSSSLALKVAALENGNLQLSFEAVAGKTYSLLATDDVAEGTWTEIGDFSGAGGTIQHLESSSVSFRYYRLVVTARP